MVFMPGDHTLDTSITVANVARLTTRGESSSGNIATVVCDELVGLSVSSMVDFKIYSLAFSYILQQETCYYATWFSYCQCDPAYAVYT